MNFIYKTLAIIYRQYVYRKIPTPYFRTIMTVIGLLFLHIVHTALLFNLPTYFILPRLTDNDSSTVKYLMGAAYFGILILIFYKVISKEKVLNIEVSESEIKKGKRVLIIYFIVDIVLLILLVIFHEIQVGRLHL
jgi:hypothetical protein